MKTLLLLALAAAPAAAAPIEFAVDPKIEALSVVLMLGAPPSDRRDAYAAAARKAFSPFAAHPAVARVAAKRRDGASLGDLAKLPLDDFEKESGFAAFFAAHARDYASFAEAARRESLHSVSPEDALSYMGAPSRSARFILAPLAPEDDRTLFLRAGVPAGNGVRFRFDEFEGSAAYELCRAAADWFRAPSGTLPDHVAAAVLLRVIRRDLGERVYRAALSRRATERLPRLAALSERLNEFEADRKRYPTLRSFSSRLDALAPLRQEQAVRALAAGDRDGARALLDEAAALSPDAETRRRMATLYQKLVDDAPAPARRDLERTEALLTGLLAESPRDPALLTERAALLARAGKNSAAVRDLAEAGRHAPDAATRRRMALVRQELKDYAGAVAMLSLLAKEGAPDASLLSDLGLCEHLSGNSEAAISDLRAALVLDKSYLPAALTLGSIYGSLGRSADERAVYDAVPAAGGDPVLRKLLDRARSEAPPPALDIAVDPRFELIGVLRLLAGSDRKSAGTEAYRERARRRFAPFRDHAAVKTLRAFLARGTRAEALATLPIYYSPPPELALRAKESDVPYWDGPGGKNERERFLDDLRGFARDTAFMDFFRENADYYRTVEARTRALFGTLDPLSALERYTGLDLQARAHYVLPLLYADDHNYIVPYPLPPHALGAETFDVYTMAPNLRTKDYYDGVWNELPFLFTDPAFHYFDARLAPDPAAYYGTDIARCRLTSPDCAKSALNAALVYRLLTLNLPGTLGPAQAAERLENPLVRELAERLAEYEGRRDLYPTLWDFFPRLADVFHRRAFPHAPPVEAGPDWPKVRKSSDFFGPKLNLDTPDHKQ